MTQAQSDADGAAHVRRQRGSLSTEEILAAAMNVLDTEGAAGLTFSRLGKELRSAPTAVYRHFASRDDLLDAIGDHLDGLSLVDYAPTDHWRTDLEELAWRAWRIAVAHPAAAGLAMSRVTNGMNELRAVDAVLRALMAGGLRGEEAVLQYQVYVNLVVGSASGHGTTLSTTSAAYTPDGWVQVYTPTDPSQYPHADAVKSQLRVVNAEKVFATQLRMYLDALSRLLPPA